MNRYYSKAAKRKNWQTKKWYNVRRLLGYQDVKFFMFIGPRENGKSYSLMEFLIKKWVDDGIPFNWIRLSQESLDRMLANNAEKFIDKPLVRKYKLEISVKGNDLYDHDKLMCRGFALSMMSKDKGVALFDHEFLKDPKMWFHIGIDEFNRERQEKKTFDLCYNLINELETLLRSTKERVRIFFAANMLEEGSEICARLFNFVPLEYGTYHLKKKQAVIEYIEPNEAYKKRREGTVASILGGKSESTFSNTVQRDFSLITKERVQKPEAIIKFGKKEHEWFTLWNHNIIKPYNKEQKIVIAMKPYLPDRYQKSIVKLVIDNYHLRRYRFDSLSCQTAFQAQIEMLKPNG